MRAKRAARPVSLRQANLTGEVFDTDEVFDTSASSGLDRRDV
jgi:hypothetical protein